MTSANVGDSCIEYLLKRGSNGDSCPSVTCLCEPGLPKPRHMRDRWQHSPESDSAGQRSGLVVDILSRIACVAVQGPLLVTLDRIDVLMGEGCCCFSLCSCCLRVSLCVQLAGLELAVCFRLSLNFQCSASTPELWDRRVDCHGACLCCVSVNGG